jgi:hypothetical protein
MAVDLGIGDDCGSSTVVTRGIAGKRCPIWRDFCSDGGVLGSCGRALAQLHPTIPFPAIGQSEAPSPRQHPHLESAVILTDASAAASGITTHWPSSSPPNGWTSREVTKMARTSSDT